MHVLEEERLAQDAATVEAALKRHEAISTDVKARVYNRCTQMYIDPMQKQKPLYIRQ